MPDDLLSEFEEQVDEHFQTVQLDFTKLLSLPPLKLIKSLQDAQRVVGATADGTQDKYQAAVNRLHTMLENEIKNLIDLVQHFVATRHVEADQNDCAAALTCVDDVLQHAPDQAKSMLSKYKSSVIQKIQEAHRAREEAIKEELIQQGLQKNVDVLKRMYWSGYVVDGHRWNEFQRVIDEKIAFVTDKLTKELTGGDDTLGSILRSLHDQAKTWLGYVDFMDDVASVYPLHKQGRVNLQDYSGWYYNFYRQGCRFEVDRVRGRVNGFLERVSRHAQTRLEHLSSLPAHTPAELAAVVAALELGETLMQLKASDKGVFDVIQAAIKEKLELRANSKFVKLAKEFHKNSLQPPEDGVSSHLEKYAAEAVKGCLDWLKQHHDVLVKIKGCVNMQTANPAATEMLEACTPYPDMRRRVNEEVKALDGVITPDLYTDSKLTTPNATDRDQCYKDMYTRFKPLQSVHILIDHIDGFDAGAAKANCVRHFESEIQKIGKVLLDNVASMHKNGPTNEETYKQFSMYYDNLRACEEHFKESTVSAAASRTKTKARGEFLACLDAKQKAMIAAAASRRVEILVDGLVELKTVGVHIQAFKKDVDILIDDVLVEIITSHAGADTIGKLGLALNKHKGPGRATAQMIIQEHAEFSHYSAFLRIQATSKFTIKEVLAGLKDGENGGTIDVDLLKKHHAKFDEEYWALVLGGINAESRDVHMQGLVTTAQGIGKRGTLVNLESIRSMMAQLFAWWSLTRSPGRASADIKEGTIQPHAAQVVAIFRLLGFDCKSKRGLFGKKQKHQSVLKDTVQNQLVEILTGEGKSVILAVTSAILALLGCTVNCTCYSEYLSKRDEDAFQDLFDAFGVRDHVTYSTFNALCESYINRDVDVREAVRAFVTGVSAPAHSDPGRGHRPRVLLVDEVDVFFSEDFYGNYYKPTLPLRHKHVSTLLKYIWRHRDSDKQLRLAAVQGSQEYRNCLSVLRNCDDLLEQCVKGMLMDIRGYKKELGHEYEIFKGSTGAMTIGYKDQDQLSESKTFGYKTLFACYAEEKVTAEESSKREALLIDCGVFSYAEVPKEYDVIMGVTGTLQTLTSAQKALLKSEYKIDKQTLMPSVFGKNNCLFQQDTLKGVRFEENIEGYYGAIIEQIDKMTKKRSILVFFETTELLKRFVASPLVTARAINRQAKIMTEETSASEKEGLVRQATLKQSITLLSKEFGRGTDFVCYDDDLNEAGGVHVLTTFLPDERAMEAQLKGRTARQGKRGSFSMVLYCNDLESKFGLDAAAIINIKNSGTLYAPLDAKRNRVFGSHYETNKGGAAEVKGEHGKAVALQCNMQQGNFAPAREHLVQQNWTELSETSSGPSRTMVLMDATGSMYNLLNKAKQRVKETFARTCGILEDQNVEADVQVQFVVYRNYSDTPDNLLRWSSWESDPKKLNTFMDGQNASGGYGCREAVEVGLHWANQTADDIGLTQVLLIGDAGANTRDEVYSKRGTRSWSGRFEHPVFEDEETDKLKARGIPVHAFYVGGNNARESFCKIASETGGDSSALDVDGSDGAEKLTNAICERMVFAVGGKTFVEAYKKKYPAGYV